MRSRDGNHSFLLSICSVIFFNSLVLSASEYLISYRYVVKDATLYNEALSISKSMQKCNGTPQNALILPTESDTNLKTVLAKNSEEFIDYIHKLNLHVEHSDVTINAQYKSTTILTLKTTCFEVDFNDNFVKISPLK